MNIGTAARQSELPAKTIRYYEEIGLVSPDRAHNGYRDYGDGDIHKLRFIQRARSLGFSIDECRQLMALYDDKSRASRDVKDPNSGEVVVKKGRIFSRLSGPPMFRRTTPIVCCLFGAELMNSLDKCLYVIDIRWRQNTVPEIEDMARPSPV